VRVKESSDKEGETLILASNIILTILTLVAKRKKENAIFVRTQSY
jgi:hypothetical protein